MRSVLGNGQVENVVQALENTLDATALLDVNDGITDGRKDVAGADDLGVTEKYDAVAVRVCLRLEIGDHCFTIEIR